MGGVLIAFLGSFGTLSLNAVTFLASALAVKRIRQPEPPPVPRGAGTTRRAELMGGLSFASRHPTLRWVLLSWLAFAGAVGMGTPVAIVFYLQDLHFSLLQYGLVLGVPSVGGIIGAQLSRRLSYRIGVFKTLRLASLLRGPWQFLIPFAVRARLDRSWCF